MSAIKEMNAVWRERAQRLSRRLESAVAKQDTFPVLVLGIGKERYGVALPDVAEVLPPMRPTPVPGTAAVFAGVINVHGEIRPVIDLRRFLGMEPGKAESIQTGKKTEGNGDPGRLVLLRKQGRELGLRIDSVEQIRWIGAGDLKKMATDAAGSSGHIRGSTQDLLMVLSTEALFAELLTGETT